MKWEYIIATVSSTNHSSLERELNKAGNQGWELVTTYISDLNPPGTVMLIFKRPNPYTNETE